MPRPSRSRRGASPCPARGCAGAPGASPAPATAQKLPTRSPGREHRLAHGRPTSPSRSLPGCLGGAPMRRPPGPNAGRTPMRTWLSPVATMLSTLLCSLEHPSCPRAPGQGPPLCPMPAAHRARCPHPRPGQPRCHTNATVGPAAPGSQVSKATRAPHRLPRGRSLPWSLLSGDHSCPGGGLLPAQPKPCTACGSLGRRCPELGAVTASLPRAGSSEQGQARLHPTCLLPPGTSRPCSQAGCPAGAAPHLHVQGSVPGRRLGFSFAANPSLPALQRLCLLGLRGRGSRAQHDGTRDQGSQEAPLPHAAPLCCA